MPAQCSCGRPVANAVLCRACTVRLETSLVTIASLAEDLDLAIARQTRMADPSPGHATEAPLPFDERASEAAWVVGNTLAGWIRALGAQANPAIGVRIKPDAALGLGRGTVAEMAAWLSGHVKDIVQRPDAEECADEIAAAEAVASRAVDRPPERRYAGPCGKCGQPLYARPGQKTITCREHEPPWSSGVEERREWMLGEVASRLAHAALAVHLLSLLEVEVTPVQVTRWKQAGLLVPRGRDRDGRTTYRIGDLIELAAKSGRKERTKR